MALVNFLLIFSLALSASVVKSPANCTSRPCTYTLDTAGSTATAGENTELQDALNDAERGDTIELTAGKIWTGVSGAFSISDVAGASGYLTIRTTQHAKLPPAGTRATPAHAANMAQIRLISSAQNAVLLIPGGTTPAQYVKFVGIEFTSADDMNSGDSASLDLIRIAAGGTMTTTANLPNYIEFERCFIHGSYAGELRNGILAGGRNFSIVDSWISEIKMAATETHAVVAYNGPGPYTITNNWLEATAIPVLTGGGTQSVDDITFMPANITITKNTFHKPRKWFSLDGNYVGVAYTNKNMLEFKVADTATVTRNYFQGNYFGANNDQSGQAVAFNIRLPNGAGSASYAVTEDVTFRDNWINGGYGVFSILGRDSNYSFTGIVRRVTFNNNLATDIGCHWSYNGCAPGSQFYRIIGGGEQLTFTNNTIFGLTTHTNMLMNAGDSSYTNVEGIIFNNNVGPYGGFGWRTGGHGEGELSINGEFNNGSYTVDVRGNVFPGGVSTTWNDCAGGKLCGSNVYPTTADWNSRAAQLWMNTFDNDYSYRASSTWRNGGLSGARLGVDMSTIPRIYGVSVEPGSTTARLAWSVSPVLVGQGCTVELSTDVTLLTSTAAYTPHADVNPTTTGSDLATRAGSVTSRHRTQFLAGQNSALTAGTQHYYRIVCGPHFVAGQFRTTSASSGRMVVFKYPTARTGEYSANSDMSSPTAISSSATHSVPVSSGGRVYYRHANGDIRVLTAP